MTTVIIIGYNSGLYLNTCLKSLMHQTTKVKEIIYVDNNSADSSVKYIEMNFPMVKIIQNSENLGYAKAANQGINLAKGDYVLILNPDMILEPDYLYNALSVLLKDPKVAAVTGKVRKYDFASNKKTKIIDTLGIVALRGRQFLDNGAGIEDKGQLEMPMDIFGVSGNCPLFCKAALMDAKIGEEYFDEHFFMYKEDVDLSWRLRLLGWKFIYTPYSIAYHGRGTGVINRTTLMRSIEARKNLNNFQIFYSLKNHRLMLLKNELLETFLRDFLSIISREIAILFWAVIKEQNTFKALIELCRQLRPILKKRHIIMKRKRISSKEVMPWLRGKGLIT